MIPDVTSRRRLRDLAEQEVLSLAIVAAGAIIGGV